MSNDNQLDDFVLPFQIDNANLRGRAIRFSDVLDKTLSAHDYPFEISKLVAETQVLTSLLSAMLKFDGIFTLQITGDAVVKMLVCDMTSEGDIRACASFDEDAAAKLPADVSFKDLIGKGYMTFTVDHQGMKDRYQGIVEILDTGLQDSIQHYFKQSEQIKTAIRYEVSQLEGKWIGAGLMIQALPEDLKAPANDSDASHYEDSWQNAKVMLSSCKTEELITHELPVQDLLYRLFHEDGVRVYDAQKIQKQCRCSIERVQNVIETLSADDKEHLLKDGFIEVKCEFCSEIYKLDP